MNKKKTIIATVILMAIFAGAFIISRKKAAPVQETQKMPQNVTVQNVKDSNNISQNITYPAITAGDQEITLTARASGTVTALNFDLGTRVGQNSQLAVIDNIGNFSKEGVEDLQSSDTEVLKLAVKQAEESVSIAKANYKASKTKANKEAVDLAELQLKSAKVSLRGALDTRFVVAPISGVVTQREVSVGDSVSVGQTIATISKTALTKIQFFVNKEDLPNFKIGTKVDINEDGNSFPGIVSRIAPEADPTTKRFLIEAKPSGKNILLIGSVINVSLDISRTVATPGDLILPLSIITIGQNESHIFIVDNGKAKQIQVEIKNVQGEFAEIKADIPQDAQIIVNGSKLVKDGDAVNVQ